jgi:formimidoylglutamase
MKTRSKFCIIGIPDHQGVIHVRGRIGAGTGPSAFRQLFYKLKGENSIHEEINDLGDVQKLSADVAQNHELAAQLIQEGHSQAGVSVIVGGGHDHGFSHLKGILDSFTSRPRVKLGCINIDAHLDVRKPAPEITSGSPFYLAMESGVLDPKRFIEFGIQSHCNSSDLWSYVRKKKVSVVPMSILRNGKAVSKFRESLNRLKKTCDRIVISLDLDAAASAFAPGVSAPQAEGFTGSEIVEMMEIAGKEKKVVSLGIFELNPIYDIDMRTARLAATAAYHFLESKI